MCVCVCVCKLNKCINILINSEINIIKLIKHIY